MPFETTDIAAKTNAQPVDAIGTMDKLANLNNAQNTNKFFQAKNIAGQYLAQSLGPDGQPDFKKLSQFLASDPRTGPYTADLLTAAKGIQSTGVSTAANQQALAKAKYSAAREIATAAGNTSQASDPVIRKNENAKSAVTALANAVDSGVFDPETVTQVLGSGDFIPTALRAGALSGAGGQGVLNAAVPQVQAVDSGGNINLVGINPAVGTASPLSGESSVISKTLTPSEINRPAYDQFNPVTNQPETVTQGQAFVRPPKGPIVKGPALGVEQAANTEADVAVKAYNAAQQDIPASQSRILNLRQALTALENSPTGPGTEFVNNAKSFLLAQGGDLAKLLPGIDPKTIAERDKATKYLSQYALNRANSLGSLTNEKLATAITGNASADISNLAAKDIVKVNIGLERMQQAGVAAFQASGLPPQNYSTFISNWSRQVDPRAFMLDQLTGAERAKMAKSMSPTELAQFKHGVQDAVRLKIYGRKDWPK